MRRVVCRYHCGVCGGHFSSLNGFAAHRAGEHGAGDRHCIEPLDDARFAELTENGVCTMYAVERVNVAVWTLAADLRRARERSGWSRGRTASPHVADDLGRAA